MRKFKLLKDQRLTSRSIPLHKIKYTKKEKIFLGSVVFMVLLIGVLAVVIVITENGANATVGNQLTSVPYAPFPTIPPS